MALEATLEQLKSILEKGYRLKDVKFGTDFEYQGERNIPGFSFNLMSARQAGELDKLQTLLQEKVKDGYSPDEVVCYVYKRGDKDDTYREVHVRIKQGDREKILESLADNLTRYLGILELGSRLARKQTRTS